jgi:hypothetical protein
MRVADIKTAAERQPFRPFTLRLNNGAKYTFKNPRDFGAPKNCRVVFYFGGTDWVPIDADSITELIQK